MKTTLAHITLLGALSGAAILANGGVAHAASPRVDCERQPAWPVYPFANCGDKAPEKTDKGGGYTS